MGNRKIKYMKTKTQLKDALLSRMGIDLPKLKSFIRKEIGPKCEDYCWDCFGCRSNRFMEELIAFVDIMVVLQDDGKTQSAKS